MRTGKCGRPECMVCAFKPWANKDMDCTKPNALYEAICLKCDLAASEIEDYNREIEGIPSLQAYTQVKHANLYSPEPPSTSIVIG